MLLQANTLIFLNELAKQGPVVALLCLAIWYFYTRQQKLEATVQAGNDKLEKYMTEDRENLTQIISNNTDAFKENTHVMESLQEHLNMIQKQ